MRIVTVVDAFVLAFREPRRSKRRLTPLTAVSILSRRFTVESIP
jgi:hypothetical protein